MSAKVGSCLGLAMWKRGRNCQLIGEGRRARTSRRASIDEAVDDMISMAVLGSLVLNLNNVGLGVIRCSWADCSVTVICTAETVLEDQFLTIVTVD
jgi:hypothetical protein